MIPTAELLNVFRTTWTLEAFRYAPANDDRCTTLSARTVEER